MSEGEKERIEALARFEEHMRLPWYERATSEELRQHHRDMAQLRRMLPDTEQASRPRRRLAFGIALVLEW